MCDGLRLEYITLAAWQTTRCGAPVGSLQEFFQWCSGFGGSNSILKIIQNH